MSELINGIKVPFIPLVQNEDFEPGKVKGNGSSFDSIFKTELDKLKFSSHATKRLESRNIELDESTINKLQSAVEKAESKGSKDSLVMLNDTAFIVNIPNRTVVTALAKSDSEENIFTNIDSVVFA
jgi:flagellar operon protein